MKKKIITINTIAFAVIFSAMINYSDTVFIAKIITRILMFTVYTSIILFSIVAFLGMLAVVGNLPYFVYTKYKNKKKEKANGQ